MKKKMKKNGKKTTTPVQEEEQVVDGTEASGDGDGTTPRRRRMSVDYVEFVKEWTKSDSVSEVAATFDIKPVSATAIASRLRKKGVDLKRFARRGAQDIDVKRLNRIAAGKED